MRRSSIDKHTPTLMVIPMLLIVVIFLGFLVYVLGLSVTNSTLAKPFNGFIGFANYTKAFHDEVFGQSLKYMLFFAIVVTFVETVLGFLFAFALYTAVRTARYIQTIALLPLFAPAVAIGMLWKLVYDPGSGFLNHYLLQWGIIQAPIGFLGNANFAMAAVMAADIWQWTPFCFLLCLAAFQSLPHDPYEAAAVDGATGWQVLRRLTIPLVFPAVIIVFLFRLLMALKVFDLVYMLTYGGPGSMTNVASFYIYKVAFTTFKTGYAASLTVLAMLLIAAIATVLTLGRTFYMNRTK